MSGEIVHHFIEVNYGSDDSSLLLRELYTHQIDGAVLKGVFSPEEVGQIVAAVNEVPDADKFFVSNGQVFPMPFTSIRNLDTDVDRYIEKRDLLNSWFGNLRRKIHQVLEDIGGDFAIAPSEIKVEGKEGEANFGNFRWLQPNLGGSIVHCENLFQMDSPVCADVFRQMHKEGELSFFLALQYPESGGELAIYDAEWPEVNGKDGFHNDEYLLTRSRQRVYLEQIKRFLVKPSPGDILVFRGGAIWHRVEPIFGQLPRITFGGFMSFSADGERIHYWA